MFTFKQHLKSIVDVNKQTYLTEHTAGIYKSENSFTIGNQTYAMFHIDPTLELKIQLSQLIDRIYPYIPYSCKSEIYIHGIFGGKYKGSDNNEVAIRFIHLEDPIFKSDRSGQLGLDEMRQQITNCHNIQLELLNLVSTQMNNDNTDWLQAMANIDITFYETVADNMSSDEIADFNSNDSGTYME